MTADRPYSERERRRARLGAALAVGLHLYAVLRDRAERRRMTEASTGRAPDPHGRGAAWPSDIPGRGWWDILMRVKNDISATNATLIAQGIAFSALVAIPAGLTALVSLYGLVFDVADVELQVQGMSGVLPPDVIRLLSEQLKAIAGQSGGALGIGFLVSLGIALWSARSGTASLISGLNIAYEEQERRGFLRLQMATFTLTLAIILFGLVALVLIAILPAVIDILPFGSVNRTIASIARWPILLGLVIVALAVIYRYAPSRDEPRWRWVSWGASLATVLWIVASALFSLYVSKFASYNKTYGSLGGVIVLLMWLYLSAFVVLLGAEVNAEIEHQTAKDSTRGRPEPMGRRDARMADTLGRAA